MAQYRVPGPQPLVATGPLPPSPALQQMMAKQVAAPQAEAVTRLYTALVEEVLPSMTRALRAPELLRKLNQAGVAEAVKATGFQTWLRSYGTKPITRSAIAARLSQQPDFAPLARTRHGLHPMWGQIGKLASATGEGSMTAAVADNQSDDRMVSDEPRG